MLESKLTNSLTKLLNINLVEITLRGKRLQSMKKKSVGDPTNVIRDPIR